MVVPGSGLVKQQAEAEGLDKIFIEAGFDWREPGCSMCLAMNADKLAPGERCASTPIAILKATRTRWAHPFGVAEMAAAAALPVILSIFAISRRRRKWKNLIN